MKKNRRYLSSAFALLFSGLAFVSCNDNDPDFVYNEKPAITTDLDAYTVTEGHELSIVLTTSKVSNVPMEVKLEVVGGTAVLGEDFELPGLEVGAEDGLGNDGFLVTFPANASTYTIKIPALLDDNLDDGNTVLLRLSGAHNMNGTIDKTVTITINNVGNVLDLTLGWDKTFTYGANQFNLCGIGYDVDFIVVDAAGEQVADAQTVNCPETLHLSQADLADGTYDVYAYLYDDAGLPGAPGLTPFNIPLNVDYVRLGSPALNGGGSFSVPAFTSASNGDSGAPNGGNNDGTMVHVFSVKLENDIFTILNGTTVVAQGKQGKLINELKAAKKAAKPAKIKNHF